MSGDIQVGTNPAVIDPVPALAGAPGVAPVARSAPAVRVGGPVGWARANLFGSWISTLVTLLLGAIALRLLYSAVLWGLVHAIWSVPYDANGVANTSACRANAGVGACWAVIADKWRFILFGRYPYDQQWRSAIVSGIFIGLFAASGWHVMWRRELLYLWVAGLVAIGVLMWGGVFGLPMVETDSWGGLTLTLMLATFGLVFAFPLALLVALGRRSRSLPAVRLLCVVYVELIRGVPLISLLFMASVMFPLFMPAGFNMDKLLRAQVAIILFAGAYLAEVVRGGLQALPRGQYEAADALGLSYWRKAGLIILPQALRMVIPPLVNTFIGFFKDTSLVLIIGIFDLLTAGTVAVAEPAWQGFATEVYLMLAAIYFVFCYAMARYSRTLERQFSRSVRR